MVDLFAGIGYYTLPLLVKAGAMTVHACEMNTHAIEGLTKGLVANAVLGRCRIHAGDNQHTAPSLAGMADRVILGLLPSSENAWPLAVDCLRAEGGVIHLHMNSVQTSLEDGSFVDSTTKTFGMLGCEVELLHLEKVKSYAPHIQHVVVDLAVKRL